MKTKIIVLLAAILTLQNLALAQNQISESKADKETRICLLGQMRDSTEDTSYLLNRCNDENIQSLKSKVDVITNKIIETQQALELAKSKATSTNQKALTLGLSAGVIASMAYTGVNFRNYVTAGKSVDAVLRQGQIMPSSDYSHPTYTNTPEQTKLINEYMKKYNSSFTNVKTGLYTGIGFLVVLSQVARLNDYESIYIELVEVPKLESHLNSLLDQYRNKKTLLEVIIQTKNLRP